MERIVFYLFAALAILASIGVVAQRNPMHSVLLLIVSFAGLSGLYIQLDAPFTAVTTSSRSRSGRTR
jgi:NADH-quinone oxidoreductase subunit J